MNIDLWSEKCIISMQPIGSGVRLDLSPVIESFSIKGGEKKSESKPTMNGGRVIKQIPQTDLELNFDAYTLGISTTTGDDVSLNQWFNNPNNVDTSEPLATTNSRNRIKVRVAILWTEDDVTEAHTAPTSGAAERLTFASCFIYTDNIDYNDGVKKTTYRLSSVPFDKDADQNWKYESTTDSSGNPITSLSSYTTSNKF